MPTQQTTYNSRVTDEALEKKFRDTFKSQGGAELVDDLYASGVIVPVVDFTSAAEGSALRSDLQSAWDFSTGLANNVTSSTDLVTTPGFWKIDLTLSFLESTTTDSYRIFLDTGLSTKEVWRLNAQAVGVGGGNVVTDGHFIVFLRSGDTLKAIGNANGRFCIWYRQIADVSGNLTNPLGFTSS